MRKLTRHELCRTGFTSLRATGDDYVSSSRVTALPLAGHGLSSVIGMYDIVVALMNPNIDLTSERITSFFQNQTILPMLISAYSGDGCR
jgi:hypothetical protein